MIITGEEFQRRVSAVDGEGKHLPPGLVIRGNVGGDYILKSLPRKLTIVGDLRITNNQRLIKKLPSDLIIYGTLNIMSPSINHIPSSTIVLGSLFVGNIDRPIYLPNNLTVGGTLGIYSRGLVRFPRNLVVGGDLYLRYVDHPFELPDELMVGGIIEFGDSLTTSRIRKPINLRPQKILSWKNGRYIYVSGNSDGYKVESHYENVWVVREFLDPLRKKYLVVSKQNFKSFAVRDTLQDAKQWADFYAQSLCI